MKITPLPLQNPVLIFTLILFIILFAPIVLEKFKIPHLIGLIIAGAVIGPNGFNLMDRDSSIVLFGTVGLLYIMFLAGLEIDIADFVKNSSKSAVFGLYTFLVPMIIGTLAGKYLLGFSNQASILLASMFASHTLISYPIISKLGITKHKVVNITVGGTMITDTLALLVLAVIAGISTGETVNNFWLRLGLYVVLFGATVVIFFPILTRWFFKRFDDNISQYIFVLAMVFLGAFLSEVAGLEAIIGAFLTGLAINRLIPRTSPLMNRIDFVGNALFIPFFLIGVGMLVDFKIFFKSLETIKVATVMISVALAAKFVAAWLTQKTFRFSIDERRLIFGLSSAQAAATLAAVLVGYNIITNKAAMHSAALVGKTIVPERLLNESVLNGTILMILVTCTVASFITQKGARNIAISEKDENTCGGGDTECEERILIPVSNTESVEELVNLSLAIRSKNSNGGLYALSVVDNSNISSQSEKRAERILDMAAKSASAADNQLHKLLRYDLNIINGITNVVKENKITDMVLGLHVKKGITDDFFGALTEGVLTKCDATVMIYKSAQPLSTVKRYILLLPEGAEKEAGFSTWLVRVWNIAKNTGSKLIFYGQENTLNSVKLANSKHPVECDFVEFDNWDDLLIIARDVKKEDSLLIVMSRRNRVSYNHNMKKIPYYLNKYFITTNFILVYPIQPEYGTRNFNFT